MSNLSDKEREHREYHWTQQNWRSWGSWFSWGSPVGLGLFFIEDLDNSPGVLSTPPPPNRGGLL